MHIPEPIPTDVHDESFAGRHLPHPRPARPRAPARALGRVGDVRAPRAALEGAGGADRAAQARRAGSSARSPGSTSSSPRRSAPGRIAFSRDFAGQCVALHLAQGEALNVREHQFIAATDNVEYSYERVQGIRNMLLGGSGLLHRHLPGEPRRRDRLGARAGQRLRRRARRGRADRRRGGRLALQGPDGRGSSRSASGSRPGFMGGGGKLTWNRFTGPGPARDPDDVHRPAREARGRARQGAAALEGGAVGAILGGLLKG